jgi:hypothetical protein
LLTHPFFYLISDEPETLDVVIFNYDVKKELKKKSLEGKYTRGHHSEFLNDKPIWKQQNGKNAIWFHDDGKKKRWVMGPKDQKKIIFERPDDGKGPDKSAWQSRDNIRVMDTNGKYKESKNKFIEVVSGNYFFKIHYRELAL